MPLSALIYFYARRLRTHPVQEALAAVGIAIGVALVFAVQIANSSIVGASSKIVRDVVGVANLQLSARSPAGFDQGLARRVRGLPGVQAAVPALDLSATATGPSGHDATVQLVSADLSLASGSDTLRGLPVGNGNRADVLLPSATARALGVKSIVTAGIPQPYPRIVLRVRGHAAAAKVRAVVGPEAAGALASAMAVFVPLRALQRAAGLDGRVNRVLIEVHPSAVAHVRRELTRLARGRLDVAPAEQDIALLREATTPNRQATGFFAFVSALVGLLLAFNAMLLSTPERRRMIAELRLQGTHPRDLVGLLLFQAACLGVVASVAGVLVGDLLSRGLFHETPGYLAAAFPLGTQTVIGWQPVVLSVAGGLLATCLAATPPLLDLRRSRAIDAVYFEAGEPGHGLSPSARSRCLGAAALLLTASVLAPLALGPSTEIAAILALAFAGLLAIPFAFAVVLRGTQQLAARLPGMNMLLMATRTLRATTARSLALAGTGAIAVFGAVAAEGAHRDLLNGLYRDYGQYVSTASLWVANPRDDLATDSFPSGQLPARIASTPGVAAVRAYQGGFLDLAGRRAWVIARSPDVSAMFPASQIIDGDAALAERRLRSGGWVLLSHQLAMALGVRVGGRVSLPTPSGPVVYRLAASTTNLGWSSGAIVLNDRDYRRAWRSADPTALEIDLKRGASASVSRAAIGRLIGPAAGLGVQTSAERSAQADSLAREGLSRLTQIALLLMVAAALAMAAAMGASIWQRRATLASLRIQSFRPSQLRIVLVCESGLVVATGAVVGALAGFYGQSLIDRYLRLITGFPAPFSPALPQALMTAGVIVGAAVLVLAVPGYIASRVPPRLALQDHG